MSDLLEGIAAADARLGGPFPLPARPLPLARWVAVHAVGATGAEVEWSLDDTRPGTPGRIALYAGCEPPPERARLADEAPVAVRVGDRAALLRTAALADAQPSLRPVVELCWRDGDRHLRITAQGPWSREELLAIAASVPATGTDSPV